MPELRVGDRHWQVPAGSNLLDALNTAGVAVPYSCRAGSCHACLVHCLEGQPEDRNPAALAAEKRQAGWRLACQCEVVQDLRVTAFDPQADGIGAHLIGCDWLADGILLLRLLAERPIRYRPGQHCVLWSPSKVARPYSLASLPQADEYLEFHIDCRHPGAFSDAARQFRLGDKLQLGEVRGGALHYDPDWQSRPLWLLASGTGLAPLFGVLREALRQEHQGPIRLLHMAEQHYLAEPLQQMADSHPQLSVEFLLPGERPNLRLLSRQTIALICGSPASVEAFSRGMFLAGLPRNQLFADVFVGRG